MDDESRAGTDESFDRDDFCFVCGQKNEDGLRVRPRSADGRCTHEWVPPECYQGYAGILHGGIISTLLDEAMAHAALSAAGTSPTVEFAVEFLKPVLTGRPVAVEARVIERRRRIVRTEAELNQEGELRARARGTFITAKGKGVR